MATKNGLVWSLVIKETATVPPVSPPSSPPDSSVVSSVAASSPPESPLLESSDPPQAAKVTDRAPAAAMTVNALPRRERLNI